MEIKCLNSYLLCHQDMPLIKVQPSGYYSSSFPLDELSAGKETSEEMVHIWTLEHSLYMLVTPVKLPIFSALNRQEIVLSEQEVNTMRHSTYSQIR